MSTNSQKGPFVSNPGIERSTVFPWAVATRIFPGQSQWSATYQQHFVGSQDLTQVDLHDDFSLQLDANQEISCNFKMRSVQLQDTFDAHAISRPVTNQEWRPRCSEEASRSDSERVPPDELAAGAQFRQISPMSQIHTTWSEDASGQKQ